MTLPSCGHVTNVVVTPGAHQIYFDDGYYAAGDTIIDVPDDTADWWIANGWAAPGVGSGGSAGTNEVQRFVITPGGSGSAKPFTLTFNGATTGPITYQQSKNLPSALEVQHALEILPTVGAGNVVVQQNGWSYAISFTGALSAQNLAQMSADDSALGGATIAVSTVTEGAAPA